MARSTLGSKQRSQQIPAAFIPALSAELRKCKQDPARFNETILCRPPYWDKQLAICRSLVQYPITCVKSGNGIGKSYVDSGALLWFSSLHPGSKSVAAAPTNAQLSGVLWAEVRSAIKSAADNGRPLGCRERGLTLEYGENWRVEGFGQGSVESKSGRHAKDLFALIDEASGVHADVFEAIASLNPSKQLLTGNPLRPEGKFYELCESRNPNVNVIEISSLDSPHAHLERSPWGMADRTFIDNARYDYGEDSIWWLVHILGKFPSELAQALLPIAWLRIAGDTRHERNGPVRLGVDIAKGNDGDESGWVARDDTGILSCSFSNRWTIEQLASETARAARELEVQGDHITFDATGVGVDFGNRLKAMGLQGAKEYMGSRDGGERFSNLRAAAGWMFRRRLDPNRQAKTTEGPFIRQKAFAIPPHLLARYRDELQGLRYALDDAGRIQLENKDDFVKRLKRSCTFLDCCFMTFAYPYA